MIINIVGQGAAGTMRGNAAGSPLSLNSVNVANFDTRTSRGIFKKHYLL